MLCTVFHIQGGPKKTTPVRKCAYCSVKLVSRLDFLDLESLYDLLLESKSFSRFSGYFALFYELVQHLREIEMNNDLDI